MRGLAGSGRGRFVAVIFALLAGLGGLMAVGQSGADEGQAKSTHAAKSTVAELLPLLTADFSDRADVFVPTVLRVAGERLYSVNLTLRNRSSVPLAGPLRLVIDGIEPAGLQVEEPSGLLDGKPSFLILQPGQEIVSGGAGELFKVSFRSEARLTPESRRELKLRVRVLGLPADEPAIPMAEEPLTGPDRKVAGQAPAGRGSGVGTGAAAAEEFNPFDDGGEPVEDAPEDLAPNAPPDPPREEYRRVFAIQERATPGLMQKKGVVGTGTGINREGRLIIHVMAERARIEDLPSTIEDVPVKVLVTGPIKTRQQGGSVSPRDRFSRPIPTGVSIGHLKSLTTGTFGCRVLDSGGNPCILSNNHVIADNNNGVIRDLIVQPGPSDSTDTVAVQTAQDNVAVLTDFINLKFDGSNNRVDAAIARAITPFVGNSTPDGEAYGTPRSRHRGVRLNLRVQKYGRTTGLTTGTIVSRNVIVNVDFGAPGFALFVDQILILGDTSNFIASGDSGSLLVDNNRRPVGLLFSGSLGGTFGYSNRISTVKKLLNITIDGD